MEEFFFTKIENRYLVAAAVLPSSDARFGAVFLLSAVFAEEHLEEC